MKKLLNKNGFSLVELLAVVVILSILITISVLVYTNVRKKILEKDYENLVVYLSGKAAEYAEDTGIIKISVEDLIQEGYIKPDDTSDIYDPRDNTSMNCYLLDMKYVDGKYEAKLGENLSNDDKTACKSYVKETAINICYFNGNECINLSVNDWFNDNVTLGVKFGGTLLDENNAQIKWITNTGFSSEEARVETKVNSVARVTYSCSIVYNEKVGNTSVVVNIDREFPVVTDIKVEESWKTNAVIDITASDKAGSGIEGYAILNDDKCGSYQTSNKFNVTANGTYKICVKDKAGNESKDNSVTVSKIDADPPAIRALDGDSVIYYNETNKDLINYFEVVPSSSGIKRTVCSYKLSTNSYYTARNNVYGLAVGKYVLKCVVTGGNGLSAEATKDVEVKYKKPSPPTVVTRYTNESGNIYTGGWTKENIYAKFSPANDSDIVTYYKYYFEGSNSTIRLADGVFSKTFNYDLNKVLYVQACNSNYCSDPSDPVEIQIDATKPTIENIAFNSTGNILTITAADSGSGLNNDTYLKIGKTESSLSWKSSTFNETQGTYTISNYTPEDLLKGIIYVQVRDKVGNWSEIKSYTIIKLPTSISVTKADSYNHYYSDGAKVTVCLNGAIGINNFTIDKQFYNTISGISVSYQYINNAYCFVDTVNNTPRTTYVYYTAKYNGSSVKSVASDSSYISLYAKFWNVTTASYYVGCDYFYQIDEWSPKPSAQVNGCNTNNRVWTYGKKYNFSFNGQYVGEYSTSDYLWDMDYSCYRFADQFDY